LAVGVAAVEGEVAVIGARSLAELDLAVAVDSGASAALLALLLSLRALQEASVLLSRGCSIEACGFTGSGCRGLVARTLATVAPARSQRVVALAGEESEGPARKLALAAKFFVLINTVAVRCIKD